MTDKSSETHSIAIAMAGGNSDVTKIKVTRDRGLKPHEMFPELGPPVPSKLGMIFLANTEEGIEPLHPPYKNTVF